MLIPLIVAATLSCDVAVVGGGSAGFAAALAAAENGSDTILIEKEAILGGTSTICGVNNWEPVCGATGTSRRVYERLAAIPGACGIWYQKYHCSFGDSFPGAFLEIDDTLTYEDTLRRHGPSMSADVADWQARYHGIVFEPDELDGVMRQMLAETGRCRVFTSVAYSSCVVREGKIAELRLSNGKVIRPKVVIDACGFVAKDAGCSSEMSANPNSVTLLFRVSSDPDAPEVPVPEDTPDTCWWATSFPVVFCVEYPNGDRNVNMLPTMTGSEAAQLGPEAAYAECLRRVFAQWKWMKKTYPQHFGDFKITEIFPRLGYRETHRIVCEHMLTGAEVKAGTHFEDEIATADHAFDSHGASTAYSGELSQPYGIPLRSLKPLGVRHLDVAGRIAGFDAAAASSCRLSRTMMELGAAAGKAAAADAADAPYPNVSSGAFAVVNAGREEIVSSPAGYEGVRIEAISSRTLQVTVDPGVSDGASSIVLCWGGTDEGSVIGAWEHSISLCDAVPVEGFVGKASCRDLGIKPNEFVRAVLAPPVTYYHVDACRSNSGYIDLGNAAASGRQYDLRCKFNSVNAALFGGLSEDKKSIFQIYYDLNMFRIWLGDATKYDYFVPKLNDGTYYDLRIVLYDGRQEAYVKKATETEYELKASASVSKVPTGLRLALFGRFLGNTIQTGSPEHYFNHYKETDLETGKVLRELVPVRYGASKAQTGVFDVARGCLYSGLNGQPAYSTTCLQEIHAYGDATGVSSPFRMPKNQGLVLMVQ